LEDFKNLPIARIGHGSENEQSTRISVDEKQAATNLIKHLQDSGRQKLAFIKADLPAHDIRLKAVTAAARALSIDVREIRTAERAAFAAGMEGAKRMMESDPQADGLICATDRVAMGAIHALYANKIPVPDKVAVTGFDDIPAASEFIPPITTIQQDVKMMVKQAFDTLLQEGAPSLVSFPGKLIVRETA
jgi:LacI family transcriptional regulator